MCGDVLPALDVTECDREISLAVMVLALLCGREDQDPMPVMSQSVLAA